MNSLNHILLKQMIDEGYVATQKHPSADLWIYNYTAKAQYEKVWNEITMQCRGLILNSRLEIVARPFKKFFNLGEENSLPLNHVSFEVFEKMDGSLGILYWHNEIPYIATRGSFESQQAMKATEILHSKYSNVHAQLNKSHTYLFEIIYPENRIVLDYGTMEDLILLAVIDTQTGIDIALHEIGMPVVKKYHGIQDIHLLRTLEEKNKEGFVIKYENGYRIKVKFDEYIRIHRIVTQVSTLTVWEFLMNDMPFDDLLDRVPDEFYEWVKNTIAELQVEFKQIEDQCKLDFKQFDTRKETAMYFMTCQYPSVLFYMLNQKNYDKVIWKMIKPDYSKPFSNLINDLSQQT